MWGVRIFKDIRSRSRTKKYFSEPEKGLKMHRASPSSIKENLQRFVCLGEAHIDFEELHEDFGDQTPLKLFI